ncbi:MAG: molybdopterin molybdotransferase MoeA [Candidatus Omnitrophica bacterium]|nr:molybdopterin molybdotransferase MoeA [Candidatus Omnitrophota bacterium]
MISVKQADSILNKNLSRLPENEIGLNYASGKVLKEDIRADRDFPPFDRVMMDGIAIKMSSKINKNTAFKIQGIQVPGKKPLKLKNLRLGCIEVLTGAVLPQNCNCVIPYEDIVIKNKTALLKDKIKIRKWQFVHKKGADAKKGIVVLEKGQIFNTPRIAIAASVGKTKVKVTVLPKIAVISTGDELVPAHRKPDQFQIRQSNIHAIQAAITDINDCDERFSNCFHLKDKKEKIKSTLNKLLQKYDILIVTGGVSMGKFDYLPEAIKESGINILFHKVSQRPGKPLLFAKTKEGKAIFGLPGNPVSSQVCLYRYVIPFIKRSLGITPKIIYANINLANIPKSNLCLFIPAKILSSPEGLLQNNNLRHPELSEGSLCQLDSSSFGLRMKKKKAFRNITKHSFVAQPLQSNNSGDMLSLAKSDGFVEIPSNPDNSFVRFYSWGNP